MIYNVKIDFIFILEVEREIRAKYEYEKHIKRHSKGYMSEFFSYCREKFKTMQNLFHNIRFLYNKSRIWKCILYPYEYLQLLPPTKVAKLQITLDHFKYILKDQQEDLFPLLPGYQYLNLSSILLSVCLFVYLCDAKVLLGITAQYHSQIKSYLHEVDY